MRSDEQAQKTVANLRDATEQAKSALADFRSGNGPVKGLTGSLAETLNYARDAMADLADNTEALKHNFLFRGFFNRRGYFDIDEITVERYRAGALESGGRVGTSDLAGARRAVRLRSARGARR